MEPPVDVSLPDLSSLFDGDWVWTAFCREFGGQDVAPECVRIRAVSHAHGREAVVDYEIEWPFDACIPNEWITIRLQRSHPLQMTRFPDDPYLPGLREACSPESAQRLVGRHVMAIPPRRMRVQVVRYRPGSHAVLRHRMGRSRLYARVVRPSAIPGILRSRLLIGHSTFTVPRLAGQWSEGGVLWFSEMPGRNLRRLLRKGEQPDAGMVLDGLESLWAVPLERATLQPFNLLGAYTRARELIARSLPPDGEGWAAYRNAVAALGPFAEEWTPTTVAHNDFYDDQMVVLPDGRIALVDIEGAGPGDPMLDVGNFLAHLKWSSRVSRRGPVFGAYHQLFRQEAIDRFGWTGPDLDLREAVCLFRICTNAVRHPTEDWRRQLSDGLSQVSETLGG